MPTRNMAFAGDIANKHEASRWAKDLHGPCRRALNEHHSAASAKRLANKIC